MPPLSRIFLVVLAACMTLAQVDDQSEEDVLNITRYDDHRINHTPPFMTPEDIFAMEYAPNSPVVTNNTDAAGHETYHDFIADGFLANTPDTVDEEMDIMIETG